jgi:hypothetical protein
MSNFVCSTEQKFKLIQVMHKVASQGRDTNKDLSNSMAKYRSVVIEGNFPVQENT